MSEGVEDQTRASVSRDLLESLVDDDECSFDHHGGCQTHGYLSLGPGEMCPQQELKNLLAAESEGYRITHTDMEEGDVGVRDRDTAGVARDSDNRSAVEVEGECARLREAAAQFFAEYDEANTYGEGSAAIERYRAMLDGQTQ